MIPTIEFLGKANQIQISLKVKLRKWSKMDENTSFYQIVTKVQTISKANYGVFNSSKKRTKPHYPE